MEAIAKIVEVERNQTRNGNTRFTVRDDQGHEYVTFRPPIGEQAERLRERTARIEFHEEEKNGFRNVYLDRVEAIDAERVEAGAAGERASAASADAVAWEAAAEAAPLIVGHGVPVSGEELYQALKPFKDRVAEDIRAAGRVDARADEEPENVLPLRKGTKRAGK
jgi:hypothetical protein